MFGRTITMWGRLAFVACIIALAACTTAHAQDWPARPVRIVSPFAAGGSSDTIGRIVADALSERLRQQFFVENRGGAGGLIGSALVANAPADGHTFLISSIGTHVIAPLAAANAGYDPIASFSHVAYLGGPPIVIAAHPSLGSRTFKELLALLKARGEPLPYVSPGPARSGI